VLGSASVVGGMIGLVVMVTILILWCSRFYPRRGGLLRWERRRDAARDAKKPPAK
jgi:hypothetical protein